MVVRSRAMRRIALASLLVAGCGGADEPKTPPPAVCTSVLPPRPPVPAPLPPVAPPAMTHPSRIVAHLELKLGPIAKQLETKVPPRIAEEHDKPAGAAGHLNYTVDRGPFRASVEHDALVVRTDIHAHAEACKGRDCYASCAPEGTATVTVPLRLTPDYRFPPSHVAFAFAKGCEVKVLGGFLRIDVTPTIAAQVEPQLRKVEPQIDASLPPLRPQAEKLWAELEKPRALPLGACATVNPRGVAEGPIAGTPESLQVRLGLTAYPEIASRACGPAAAPSPLPPLAQDPQMPADDEAVLALVSPLANVTLVGGPVTRAVIAQSGDKAQLDVTLHGETCGDATLLAPVEWDGSNLRFAAPEVAKQTFPPAVAPGGLALAIPALAASASDANANVSAQITDVKPMNVVMRNGDVVAYALARGHVAIAEK